MIETFNQERRRERVQFTDFNSGLPCDILHYELRDRAEVSQRCARKTVVANYRQRNSLRIKVVSNGYYLSSKEARDDGMDDRKGEAFDLPKTGYTENRLY